MTVNYRRSVNGSNDQLGRKFLSDQIVGYWGTWINFNFTQSIAYDDLPPEPGVMARLIFDSPGAASAMVFQFNAPQNLNGKVYEFWIRKTGGAATFVYYIDKIAGTYQYYKNLGNLPAVWTKYTLPVPDVGGVTPNMSRIDISSQVRQLDITMNIVGAYRIELAGVNFRRQ